MIKVGIVGCGFMGRMHNNCHAQIPEDRVVAAADIRPDILKLIATTDDVKGYATAKDLIEKSDVDLVDVTLPTFLHAEHAIMALEHGKHVLCEKPMALNTTECQRMIDAAKANGRKLMVAHCVRFWPEYEVFKKFYDEKTFGKLLNFTAVRIGAETTQSWENWMLHEERSGSQSLDRHIHDTDFIYHVFGKPKSVSSVGSETGSGVSHIYTHFEYDGPIVVAEGSADQPVGFPFIMSFEAIFENGALLYSCQNSPTLMAYQNGKEPWAPELPVAAAAKQDAGGNISSLGAYYNEIRYFIDCILNDKEPDRCKPEEAKVSVEIALAEIKSARSLKRISL